MGKNIIIVGGGQAAAYASKEIISLDPNVNLILITEEKHLPYEKPPLSKDYLLDKTNLENLFFFNNNFYKENNIKTIFEEKIINFDFNKKILSSNKNQYNYDKLLLATGSKNKILNLKNVEKKINDEFFYLRNFEEGKNIRNKIKNSNHITIIGGGFIGLEIASSASQLGKKVSIIEIGKQLMGRIIPSDIANLVQNFHEKEGNNFFLNNHITEITKEDNKYKIILNSNQALKTDMIIVGVGSSPNTSYFLNTSLNIDNGIVTDEFSRTSIKDVYAAGDVSNFYHPFYKKHIRLESYINAQNQGINAAKNLLGIKTSYDKLPWMWSDQFSLNLQLTGICDDYDTIVKRGDSIEYGIIYFFLKNNLIFGACGLGHKGKIGKDIRLAEKISQKKIEVTKEILSDTNLKLNNILK